MAGVGDVTGMSGQIQSQVSNAAKPSQQQTDQTLKASTGALNEAAQSAQTKPTEAQGQASGQPGTSSAASSTAAANTDPNTPRA